MLAVRIYGLRPRISRRRPQNNGILVFVDRVGKMVHLVAVPESITAPGCDRVFIDTVYKLLGLPVNWSRIEIDDSRRSFGKVCSDPSEYG